MSDLDIGQQTHDLRAVAESIFKIWMFMPARQAEFGRQEISDIEETIIGLSTMIRQHRRKNLASGRRGHAVRG
jgi:hypothetical protein